MKNFRHLFLLLLAVFGAQCSCAALRSVTIKSKFASTEYEITLYDVRHLITPYATNVNDSDKDKPKHIFAINPDISDAFNFSTSYEVCSAILPLDDDGKIAINYDKKRIKKEDFATYKKGKIDIKTMAFKDLYSGFEGEYYTPVAKGSTDERANLFDLFSLKVDKYLSKLGVKEVIEQNYTAQQQISVFGEIKIKHKDEIIFFEPGFFQYTFFEDNGKYYCYHRAFKPIRSFHIIRLNRAGTRMIWCKVIAELLAIWPFKVDREENLKYFEQYLNLAESFLKANQKSDLDARLRVVAAI